MHPLSAHMYTQWLGLWAHCGIMIPSTTSSLPQKSDLALHVKGEPACGKKNIHEP